ncbi:C-C motif chemokine 19a.1 isoform X1 [Esox lucius]|uniref:Chemokine interleukin-8-like domain-containing protein n=1 Tax=Esox lucius TaxID=8010 RepID=A0A3P9AK22_ESOLU|nr:C-C motif chemokine 19a.1 isoform X1 [Esox lucius]
MATMGSVKLLLCVLFLCSSWETQGQIAMDCCLSVKHNVIPKHIVKSYQSQVRGQGCSIDAEIFITVKERKLCAPPNSPWVTELKDHTDRLIKKCPENNFKGKQCKRFKPKSS